MLFSFSVEAQKRWTSTSSGLWGDTNNWSGHILPDITSFVEILTNDPGVTVTIDATTDPASLTIQSLKVGAPAGATNVLLLSGTTNNPLVLQTALAVLDGGVLHITNGALLLQLTNYHADLDGQFILDSGMVDFGDITVTTRVGRATSGTFTINDGTVSAGAMTVGGLTNSSGTLFLNGGVLNVGSLFSLGRNPMTTGTVFVTGGQLNATGEIARVGDTSLGQMTISNTVVLMTNLNVGRDAPSLGTVTVQNGASVIISNELSLGRFSGATGTVAMAGGSLAGSDLKIHVGYEGDGELIVSNGVVQAETVLVAGDFTNTATGLLDVSGGSLVVSSSLSVGAASFSTGQVAVTSGSVFVTNVAGGGVLSIANGNLSFSAGSIVADHLALTNTSGNLVFNGGTLNSGGTTVANGAAFVVGDGSSPATFHLSGGTHSFAGGLVISSNATLTGCGTIIGSIMNHGTIATNCGPALVRPQITQIVRKSGTNFVTFSSVLGETYTLEYKNSPAGTVWTSIPPATNGTGLAITLIDISASGSARFYRVSAQ
jgi:T5SS/PEP-CTERM-associated repeat protein